MNSCGRKPILPTLALAALIGATGANHTARAQAVPQSAAAPAAPKPFVVEFYYKVRWGFLDEFLALYKKNHYPILQRLQRMGNILEMSAAFPANHAGEANRWDLRFTIVYRDAIVAHEKTPEALVKELFPDQVTFKKEEQRRFELLIEHMDVPVTIDDLKTWR